MAESINIKVLIDAAESAKTIQETKKALKDLRSAALQVEEGSQAFQSITTAAGQLQDRIGDLAATTQYLGDDLRNLKGLTSIGQGIAGGFAVAQGAAALFGGENKKLEESLLKVQSAMALLQGVQAIGEVLQKESAATLFTQNALRTVAIRLTSEQAVAQAAEAVAAGTATIAQRALNAAMNANPVMALVSVLLLAVGALAAFSGKSEEAEKAEKQQAEAIKKTREERKRATEELKKYSEYIGNEAADYVILAGSLKESLPGSRERLNIIKEMNEKYGTHIQNLKDEKAFQDQVSKSVGDYIEMLKKQYSLEANKDYIKQNIAKQAALQKEIDSLKDVYDSYGVGRRNDLIAQKDALDTKLQWQIKYSNDLIESISKTGLKMNNQTVSDTKKTNKSVEDEQKNHLAKLKEANDDYAASLKDLNDFIIETNAKGYAINLEDYQNSLNGQIDALTIAAQEELTITNDKYNEIMLAQEEAAKAKIQAEKDAKQTIISNYDDLLAANGAYQSAIAAKANFSARVQAKLEADISKIVKEETQKRLKAQQEVAKAIIAPAEFGKFVDYMQHVERQVKASKDGIIYQIEDIRKYSSAEFILFDYEKKATMQREEMEKQLDAAKKFLLSYDAEVAKYTEKANQEITDEMNWNAKTEKDWAQKALASLKEKHTKALAEEKSYTKQLEDELNARLSSESFNKLVENYSTRILEENKLRVEKYKADLEQYEKDKKLYDKQLKAYNLYITNKLTDTKEGQKLFIQSQKENNKLVTSMPIEPMFPADEFAKGIIDMTNAIGSNGAKINTALDEVANDVIGNKKLPEALKAVFGSSEATEENLKLIFDPKMVNKYQKIALEVETKNSEVFNLKMAALYQDKYKTIVGTEEEINKDRDAAYEAEKLNYNARVKELEDFNKKTAAEQAKMVKPIVPTAPVAPKKFALSPKAGQVGIADLTEQETKKINEKLEERYNLIEKAENKWYEEEFFRLYQSLQDKTISQEEYYKKLEELEKKHQDNIFDTQVVYGKKGQKDIADKDKENYKKRVADKAMFVDEMINLERILAQGIMDIVNTNYDQKISGMNQEYDLKVANIEREKKAYEDSLTETSNAELFIEEKKQEFQDRIDAQNAERAAKEKQLKQEQFNKQKAADIIQAGVNGALAFTKALALTGPYALAIQGLVAAQVASQIFFIASAENPYAEGGLVTGPGGPKDDKIRARLSNGESVINAKSTKMFAPVLSYINQAGGGKAIPSQGGGKMALGGGGAPMTVGQEPMNIDLSRLEEAIDRLNERPIETYVKESRITAAQNLSNRENRRTSF